MKPGHNWKYVETSGGTSAWFTPASAARSYKRLGCPRQEQKTTTRPLLTPTTSVSLSTAMTVTYIQSADSPYGETIVVAELWGLNSSVDASPVISRGIVSPFGQARKHIFRSIKQMLKQRQLGHIDVVQYNISNPDEPLAETMRALNDIVQAGYVRYVIISSFHVWQLRAMRVYNEANGLTPYVSFQELSGSTWEEPMAPPLDRMGSEVTSIGSLEKPLLFESLA
ncbi:aldo/keto reductase family domain-containing protein [Rhizoctonia solani AG-1 IA]|uniref:Aldo/keto reductase family domain-containing protein n=1 Tax=Thanatephorus cucumeris (strain AG1-IA) TaxID=983506 RepID=L8WLQ1_THACA|nr:aldo/keto reductase family domain-containing protein [Rhizoctonia solani AG-1 IA]